MLKHFTNQKGQGIKKKESVLTLKWNTACCRAISNKWLVINSLSRSFEAGAFWWVKCPRCWCSVIFSEGHRRKLLNHKHSHTHTCTHTHAHTHRHREGTKPKHSALEFERDLSWKCLSFFNPWLLHLPLWLLILSSCGQKLILKCSPTQKERERDI